jgi:tRNA A37 methylthiotransferase MiaB
MEHVKYDFGFMFAYSERPGTLAAKKLEDDIPLAIKKRRLAEIIALQQEHSHYRTKQHLGKIEEVLIEGTSKISEAHWKGRNTQNTVIVFSLKTPSNRPKYNFSEFLMINANNQKIKCNISCPMTDKGLKFL